VLFQIVLIDNGRRLRQLASLLEQPFDKLSDEVGFQVDLVINLLESKCRDGGSMRNDGDAEGVIGGVIDRQADPIDRHRAFVHTVPQDVRGRFDDQHDRIALLTAAADRAHPVDVTSNQMPADPFIEFHRALEIDRSPTRQLSEGRDRQGFRRRFDHKGLFTLRDHRETRTVDADTVPDLEIGQHRRSQDRQASATEGLFQQGDGAHFFHNTGEHQSFLRMTCFTT
jgi:hypothetical protein